MKCHEQTVRATLQRWEQDGLGGLWKAAGRGAKRKWQEADLQSVEQWLEQDPRTYNSSQLSGEVGQGASGAVERTATAAFTAKKGFCWKRTRHSHRGKQDPEQKRLKQADLDTLKLAAQDGHIDMKYLDESGCCL